MSTMVPDVLLAGLNCSRNSIIARHSQQKEGETPIDLTTLEMRYNSSCSWIHRSSTGMSSILNDKLGTAIMILTIITNVLICIVLTRKHMVTSTNVILLAMAIADMLTSVFPLPVYIATNFTPMIPRSLLASRLITISSQYLPTSWHAASVWLTVYLAVHRFIFMSFPTRVASWCSVRKSSIITFSIFVLFLLFNSFLLFETLLSASFGCDGAESQWQSPYIFSCTYSSDRITTAYLLSRLAVMHILPCVTLTIFTFLLVLFMHSAVRNRRRLLKSSHGGDNHSKEANSTSRMLIVVLVIFLVVEIPTGITVTIAYFNSEYYNPQLTEALNFAIVVSYPVNFFVYCGMSRQFRDTFRNVLGLHSSHDTHNHGATTRTEVSRFVRGSLRPQETEGDAVNGLKKNGKEKKKKKKEQDPRLAVKYEVEDPREPRHLLPPSPSAARKEQLPLETEIDGKEAEKETLVPRGPTA